MKILVELESVSAVLHAAYDHLYSLGKRSLRTTIRNRTDAKYWVGKKMGQNLRVGLTAVDSYLIKSEHAAKHLGSGEVEALSTPAMIAFMEKTARKTVESKLPEGDITVGTRLNIRHLGPVPTGENLKVTAQLLAINKRRLTFDVKAEWKNRVVGKGQHERFIVNKEKFLQKMERNQV